ncbi:alpha/beta fold hydrolase [Streptomyces sp. NPDC046759]|uniref:thioesterase II family protein n=1 Tax=Streptomyces sp. NPDC046759 TaxID=3155019 RepID=UPI003404D636
MPARPGPWTSLLRPRTVPPRRRLVVFPHAASGPNAFLPLLAPLHADCELVGVTLPGRERRFGEEPVVGLDEVVDGIVTELADRAAQDGPRAVRTVFHGHSLGALLALAAAGARPDLCTALVVSAAPPGGDPHAVPHALDHAEGRRALLESQGVPQEVLDDPGLLDHADRLLAADLRLTRAAAAATGDVLLSVPVTALAGDRDRLVDAPAVAGWARHTTGPFRHHAVDGDHWFPFTARHQATVRQELAAALAQPSPHPSPDDRRSTTGPAPMRAAR